MYSFNMPGDYGTLVRVSAVEARITKAEADTRAVLDLVNNLIGVVERLQTRQEQILAILAKITAAGDKPK